MNILIDGQTFSTPEIHRGIGIYMKNLINYMLKIDYGHTWYLSVANTDHLNELDSWVQNKVHVIIDSAFAPGTDYNRNAAYTEKLQDVVKQYHIDAFWIPNALMVNILFINQKIDCKIFVVIHDIIPYIFPDKDWEESTRREYLRRLEYLQANKVELIFDSKFSAEDYISNIGNVSSKNIVPLAADNRRFYQKWERRSIQEPYILFTGGFDYRKNIDGAITAYELAIKKYANVQDFHQYRFVIVGDCKANLKAYYEHMFSEKGLLNKIELTGYVSDEKLAQLYKNADIFFFPSKYEGFGLPILEAMLAGDYIVSADNSSLPEVCGGYALLCDENNPDNMADTLYQAYCNRQKETQEEVNRRQQYAMSYSWEKTARMTLDIIEHEYSRVDLFKKAKIAIFTPWPKQKTGIANYMYKFIPYLLKYFEIDIYTDAVHEEYVKSSQVSICDMKEYSKRKNEYLHTIYELGNNVEFHKTIYDMFEKNSDIAEIHDYVLIPFFYEGYFKRGKKAVFKELLELGYGDEGRQLYQYHLKNAVYPDVLKYPLSIAVARKSNTAIVHNHWAKEQLCEENVFIIPHACFDKEQIPQDELTRIKNELKQRIAYKDEILIGCFGWINFNKKPEIIIDAVASLVNQGYKVKLIFWGEVKLKDVYQKIENMHLENYVFVSGYLEKNEYEAALDITDIVVNLRYPSMGESSGTLCEAFKYGKAVIVGELNQYNEFPDEVCWKVPICNQELELLIKYLQYLIENPGVREVLGNNAKHYADIVLDPAKIAFQYFKAISSTIQRKVDE